MNMTTVVDITSQMWCAILLFVFLFCLAFTKRLNTKYEKLVAGMMLCNFGALIFEIVALLLLGSPGKFAWYCSSFCIYVEFTLTIILSYFYVDSILVYVGNKIESNRKKYYRIVARVLTCIAEFVLAYNLFHPVYYMITAQNEYVKLSWYPFLYLQMMILIFEAIFLLIKVRKIVDRAFIWSYLSYVLMLVAALILTITVGGMAYGHIGISLSMSVLFLNQQFTQYKMNIQEKTDRKIQQIQENEKIVYDGIIYSMQYTNPDENIQSMLEYLGKNINAERIYIVEKNENGNDSNTYEWCAEGIMPKKDNLQNLPAEVCWPWYDRLAKNKAVSIYDIEEIKESDTLIYQKLKPHGIERLYVQPLYDGERIIGFIGIDNPSKDRLPNTYEILGIVAYFVNTLLKKRNLLEEMEKLSYTDATTGAENRLSMYKMFNSITKEKNIGVVFCDINGLKEINDTMGHAAGDRLIKSTYQCIVSGFTKSKVFRIGGDEFVVLLANTTEEEMNEKTAIVRAALLEHRIEASIGVDLLPQILDNLKKTLSIAEKRMYEEKAQWYKKTGKDHR